MEIEKARRLAFRALTKSGAVRANVRYLVDAIIDSELVGMSSHGFFWLPIYCSHLRCGKVDGAVKPVISRLSPVSFRADARSGFAHRAIEQGFAKIIPAAKKYGIAALAITNSYNCGRLGGHTERLAREGLLAMGFTNAPASIAPPGGTRAVIGTNPVPTRSDLRPGVQVGIGRWSRLDQIKDTNLSGKWQHVVDQMRQAIRFDAQRFEILLLLINAPNHALR